MAYAQPRARPPHEKEAPTRLHRSARWYAAHGWEIFPLRPHTKEPYAGLGVYQATSDPGQIERWWAKWPEANIGLHCGGSGLLAIDIDQYKETFAGAGPLSRADEETVTSLTGGGGTHLLYALPAGVRYGNATGNLPAAIDVRGYGGYIVLPPSVHPSGTLYQWEAGYGPHELAVRPLPAALQQLLDEGHARQHVAGPPDAYAVRAALKIVESVILRADLAVEGPMAYGQGGRRWILTTCPFNPTDNPHGRDRAAFLLIRQDGHIAAGCQHARCRETLKAMGLSGWGRLLAMAQGR